MEQLTFLDRFLRIYGINGLSDYTTKITSSQYKNKQFLEQINSEMTNLKIYFKTGQLNLARKEYKVDTSSLAISILKNCLQQSNVPFEIVRSSKNNYLRLIPINKTLMEYINQTVENIAHKSPKMEIIENGKKMAEVGGDNGEIMDYGETVGKMKIKKLFTHSNHRDMTKGNFNLIHAMILNESYANINDRGNTIYIQDDDFSVIPISQLLQIDEQYLILDIRYNRGYDLVYNFSQPEYLTGLNTLKMNDVDFLTRWYLNQTEQEEFNNNIVKYGFKVGDNIFREFDPKLTSDIKNSICSRCLIYDTIRIYFDKKVLSEKFLKSSILIKYTGAILDCTFRNDLTKKYHQHNGFSNYYIESDQCPKIISKKGSGETEFIFKGKENGDWSSEIPKTFDLVGTLEFVVKNLKGEEFTDIISAVEIKLGPNIIFNQFNSKLTKIIFDPGLDMIPNRILSYNGLDVSVRVYQPLLDDQYISLKMSYLNLDQEALNKFIQKPYKLTYDLCTLRCDSGICNLIPKEFLNGEKQLVSSQYLLSSIENEQGQKEK